MKQLYNSAFLLAVIFSAALIPLPSNAQCNCPGGEPIDSVIHTRSLSGILPFTSSVNFPKFDPAIGSLTCLRITGDVTTTLNMDLVNRDSTARVIYEMFYTRVTSLTGPGISVSANENKIYGPYDLGQATVDPDTTVTIGPDTIFHNRIITQQTSNTVPYTGASGTVAISYYNNGSYLMTQGNDNFRLTVAATSLVNLRLAYYWCPNAVLPASFKSFSVVRRRGSIGLQWATENELRTNTYTVEYSRDGTRFTAIDIRESNNVGNVQYTYDFLPADEKGRYYFRIRQTDSKGKVKYSPVRTISFNENETLNTTVFPNPAVRNIQVQFESPQTGKLQVDLLNVNGQILENQQMVLNKATSVQIDLVKKPVNGMYWLRVRNTDTGEQSVTRISIL